MTIHTIRRQRDNFIVILNTEIKAVIRCLSIVVHIFYINWFAVTIYFIVSLGFRNRPEMMTIIINNLFCIICRQYTTLSKRSTAFIRNDPAIRNLSTLHYLNVIGFKYTLRVILYLLTFEVLIVFVI